MFKKISLLGLVFLVAGCSGQQTPQVQAMQKKDKQLTCKELLLEMNEAQFYEKMAEKNKSPSLSDVLMPLGYISTYVSANNAIDAASARVEYLDKIYSIMDCDAQKANGWQQQQSYNNYYPSVPMAQYPMQQQPPLAQYVPSSYNPNTGYMPDPRLMQMQQMQQMQMQQQMPQQPRFVPANVAPAEDESGGNALQRMY